jgi:hypothetical protein
MDEAEWLACADPDRMLKHLGKKYSGRKLRLFAVACCRSLRSLLVGKATRCAVEVAERFADGLADERELDEANDAAETEGGLPLATFSNPAVWITIYNAFKAADNTSAWAAGLGATSADRHWDQATFTRERANQSQLLREIVGNPFRPVIITPEVLAWAGGTVVKMAQAIYGERRFGELPVLADALEDAGCTDAAILAHCRGPGEHFRGCWVVDLLLKRT